MKAPLRVSQSEEAYIVPGLEGNRRLKYTLMVGIGALALGFAGLVGWEYRSRRVTHTDEVTADLGVRLLGTVPPLSRNAGGTRSEVPPALLVEAIDTTRTMLLHGAQPGAPLRTLVVTSAIAGGEDLPRRPPGHQLGPRGFPHRAGRCRFPEPVRQPLVRPASGRRPERGTPGRNRPRDRGARVPHSRAFDPARGSVGPGRSTVARRRPVAADQAGTRNPVRLPGHRHRPAVAGIRHASSCRRRTGRCCPSSSV